MLFNKRLLRAGALLLFLVAVISMISLQYYETGSVGTLNDYKQYTNTQVSSIYSSIKSFSGVGGGDETDKGDLSSEHDVLKEKLVEETQKSDHDSAIAAIAAAAAADENDKPIKPAAPSSSKTTSAKTAAAFKKIKDKLKFKSIFKKSYTPQDIVDDNTKFYQKTYQKKIDEPKGLKLTYKTVGDTDYQLANATLLTLVRNSELEAILGTIKQIEQTFNALYNYPYHFISEEPFTKEFKTRVESACSGDVFYSLIPAEMWNIPDTIDPDLKKKGVQRLLDNNIQYADMDSYHNMCRFNSGYFYKLKELENYKYYWRFEPGTNYYCQVDYDLFKFMEDNDKTYGFTIALYDNPYTVETLWEKTMNFIEEYPEYVNPNAAFQWLTENVQNPKHAELTKGYSTCHFWSNFEIGDMDFYRGEAYSSWFDMLEADGGFYYERWGDAPVHSIGLALFEDKKKIHWFRDVCYFHSPYFNCANSPKNLGGCTPGYFAPEDVLDQNCLSNWIRYEMDSKDIAQY